MMFPYKSHSCLISFALVISTGEPQSKAVVAAFGEIMSKLITQKN